MSDSDDEKPVLPGDVGDSLPLVRVAGEPISDNEISRLEQLLGDLETVHREMARNQNAAAIATHESERILVVAGPGTGKSTLFAARVRHWRSLHPERSIAVATFVRKLVRDLRDDITNDSSLSDEDKKKVSVATLHRQARSIVEQNHGTSALRLEPHCRIVALAWEEMVWVDAVSLYEELEPIAFPWEQIQGELYDGSNRQIPPGRWFEHRTCAFSSSITRSTSPISS